MSHTVSSNQRQTIGNSMAALYSCPSISLALFFIGRITALPPYSRWINQNFGTVQCHQASSFGKPLVPANKNAQTAHRRIDWFKAQIARSKIKFFIICRIVWNMHLTVFPGNTPVGIKNYSRIMI